MPLSSLVRGVCCWKGFFLMYKLFSLDLGLNAGINQVFEIVKDKKSSLKEVLSFPININKGGK